MAAEIKPANIAELDSIVYLIILESEEHRGHLISRSEFSLIEVPMFAITGISGQVGGAVARTLIQNGKKIKAVVRDKKRAEEWAGKGCEAAIADIYDADALNEAFRGVEGVFALFPPVFDPKPDFPEARKIAVALKSAIEKAHPRRVVYLSTIGADAGETNLLTQHTIVEGALRDLPVPVTFLRAAWFMENALWDVPSARNEGVLNSFLQPLNRAVPMIATADIGKLAAQLLTETWKGSRVVELEGPARYSPIDLARVFSLALGHPVRAQAVPRDSWESLFRAQGIENPMPRIRMLDGLNEGWIEFNRGVASSRKGATELQTVISSLVARPGAS